MRLFPHRLIFIRHGETTYNAEGRLQGQRDVALNDVGRAQAVEVARLLQARCAAEVDRLDRAGAFYCSPLVRARETLELARAALGLDPLGYALAPALVELSFGRWEGLVWSEVQRASPGAEEQRAADKWGFTPPGGESYAALAVRVSAWLAAQDGDRFVASHGGVARTLLHLLAGVDPDEAATTEIRQGDAMAFEDGGYRWLSAANSIQDFT